MRAAVLYEQGKPPVIERVEVADPKQGEVLVRMVASGVCHSDLHVINGHLPANLPVVMGHEGAGVVERVGPGVTSVQPGDHVVLLWRAPCNRCYFCGIGKSYLCPVAGQIRWTGCLADGTSRFSAGGRTLKHFGGVSTFSEYTVVMENAALPVRKDVPLDRVALVGCGVMTGVGAVFNTAKVEPGSRVAIWGAGGVGLNVVQACAMVSADRIIVVDILDNKLEMARQFGATHTVNARDTDPVQAVRDLTDGYGADYTFEVIGNPRTIAQAYEAARPGGTAVVVGASPVGETVSIEAASLVLQEKRLIGSLYGSTRPRVDMPRLLDLYVDGKLKLDELITRRYRLDQLNEAFAALERGEVARSVVVYD